MKQLKKEKKNGLFFIRRKKYIYTQWQISLKIKRPDSFLTKRMNINKKKARKENDSENVKNKENRHKL